MDYKVTGKLFGTIFGERVSKKYNFSIWKDSFNLQSAIAMTQVYSKIAMIVK